MAEKKTDSNSTNTTAGKTTVKVTATAKPSSTAKPATATTKPATATKPTVTAKPATTAKATVTAKPATTVAKPVTPATAEIATATAVKSAKPAPASVKAQPVKTAEPVKEVKPAKEVKAEEKVQKPEKVEKAEKPVKEKKVKEAKTSGEGSQRKVPGWVAAINAKLDWRFIGLVAGISIFITACMLGLIFGLRSCLPSILPDDIPTNPWGGDVLQVSTVTEYSSATRVGYSSEIIEDKVERVKPVEGIQNGGLVTNGTIKNYPTYGKSANYTLEQKRAVITESIKLTANGTWRDVSSRTSGTYDKMDKDGYLYRNDGKPLADGVPAQLYKHTASVGLYGGNVSDSEPAVTKKFTFKPRSYSRYYNVTGLYAPAGEVIKVQMTDADMKSTGGITIHIGQALYNGQANNIWEQRGINRMPIILNTMVVTQQTATYDEDTGLWTAYVGSFLGGPIYVRHSSATYSLTISGAVKYSHFILGVTSEEEFNKDRASSAPYFDLEVWESGVLHSGPKSQARNFSYSDLHKAAVYWEKVSLVSTTGNNQGVVFLYDPFVAAGAAVAFPGRGSVNCPTGWMSGSLNYNAMVTSGSWGNMHEYHHNFQNYGLGSGADGEVTNNGLNLVSYSLFTKISSSRQLSGYGGSGLSGWNQYTSASWALQRVNNGSIGSTNGLAIYATLLHNFGQDAYIKARGSSGKNNYLNKWATVTHQDFTYYAERISSYGGGTYTPSQAVQNANYPLFVPVSSVYQTGRSYVYDGEKRYIETMQPFVIPADKEYTVDLNPYKVNSAGQYESGSVVIGNGFTYKIKSVNTDGINGTFVKKSDGVYAFTPNSELRSGKIYVTLEIYYGNVEDGVREYNGHRLDDVDLVLEFQQSHEANKSVLARTTYTYTAENMYTDAEEAFNSGFANYETTRSYDHSNPTQNSNTDIWYWPTTTGHESYVETHPEYFARNNDVEVIDGKLFFREDGKYRVYLRGRLNCALYFSLDGKDYKVGATIKDETVPKNSHLFRPNDRNTYFDVEFDDGNCTVTVYTGVDDGAGKQYSFTCEGERWVHIKEVLIVQSSPAVSYIGVGMSQWTTPMYTAEVKYYFMNNDTRQDVTEETTENGTRYYYTSNNVRHYVERDGTRYRYDSDGAVISESTVGAVQSETIYKDANGEVVTAEQASNTDPIPPVVTDKSQPYVTAYKSNYQFQKQFESEYFYKKSYNYNYIGTPETNSTWNEGVTLVETNYVPETAPYGIENLFKEGQDTYTHSKANQGKGVYITLDMGKKISADSITFLGRTDRAASTAQQGLPNKFTLAISDDGENFEEVGEFTNSKGAVHSATVSLNKVISFRYVKITVISTHSNTGRIILSGVYFTYAFRLNGNGNNHITPDNKMFTYRGDWEFKHTTATFGHVYVGKNDASMEFEYEGARFAIMTSKNFGNNYEVYIDDVKVDSVPVKEDNGVSTVTYLSPELSEGKHKIIIRCKGEANIESVLLY
ncbi:MAG: hypothetical protein HDQ88_00520 [Clostridia bacterium]|nr:hypothetical protein [Clostridia bacterium]